MTEPLPDTSPESALHAALRRLFALPGTPQPITELAQVDASGLTRAPCIVVRQGRHWPALAALLDGLAELDLPPAAVSVEASGGFRVWLALAEAQPAARAHRLLRGLQQRYLAELPAADVTLLPRDASPATLPLLPQAVDERWSAFIDPTLGSLFADGDGLDFPPDPERQAALLAAVAPIRPAQFERALAQLDTPAPAAAALELPSDRLPLGGGHDDPKAFLLAVMNDPTVAAAHRIAAAQALLPYWHRPLGQ